ncbi:MAG TPA: helix-turn-helix transcriptional regulator [Candidatus Baltobacteraceae bacterium]|nr:helix-turn-helix transcriptional regulator [Candidatus Baltobacteraceae bacterium]
MSNGLGDFLKDRRTKLDAASFGYNGSRRRTPGLRREEVAERAGVSTTWYTWLEQGRGGPPSADVLDRLADALALTDTEREHLFLLAQNRPPEVRHREAGGVSPQLQRILDAMEYSAAYIKTPEWDVVAWNRVAAAVFRDLMALPEDRRNLLRVVFDPRVRETMLHWESVATFVVATFRTETARAGVSEHARTLVDELSVSSPEFRALWRDHAVRTHGEGTKYIAHPIAGPITLEYSAFAIDGKRHLSMVVYNPATPHDKAAVQMLLETAVSIS